MSSQSSSDSPQLPDRSKVTLFDIAHKKIVHQPITMLTAYDYSSAILVDRAGIDVILVGDSLGMVMMGLESTVPVTMEEMLHHCRAVARGAKTAFLVGDMPFLSYQADISEAVRNAGRFLKEGGMEGVKIEGGREVMVTTRAIVNAGIPVMGHIGLTPQSVSKLGGYRVQGKTAEDARRLLEDALLLEEAGCFSIVLEAIPEKVAEIISQRVSIPTIGIGAGARCDGQVLVYHDLIGLFDRFQPKFVKQYFDAGANISEAIQLFSSDVLNGLFPASEHTYSMEEAELSELIRSIDD